MGESVYGFQAFLFPLNAGGLIFSGEGGVVGILQVGGKPGKQGGQVADHGHVVSAAAVYHVLAHDHAKAVAVIVPSGALHLDMLAQHVKAQLLHGSDVVNQGLVRRSRIEAVRPVALIQHAHEEVRLVVQTKERNPVLLFNGKAAQSKVTGYLVCSKGNGQVIE